MMKKLLLFLILCVPFGISAMKRGADHISRETGGAAGAMRDDVSTQQEFIQQNFFQACKEGNVQAASALLEQGAQLNERINKSTPLFVACLMGHEDIVRLLLEKGADASTKSKEWSPLYTACVGIFDRPINTNIITMLLDHPAVDINETKATGYTALHGAVLHGRIDAVRLLLQRCAKVNTATQDRRTPLMHASRYYELAGSADMVRLLLDAGADLYATDRFGRTALDIATENDIRLMLRNAMQG